MASTPPRRCVRPSGEADLIARRKALCEARHPETKHSETRNGGLARQVGDPEKRADRFTASTARTTGQSERAVQRAATRLRWDSIDACELPTIDRDEAKAAIGRMAEVAENLHRREIGQIERAELVAEWIRITKERKVQSGQHDQIESKRADGKGHRTRGGNSEAARQLGIPRKSVERSLKVASLSPAAKETARKLDLDGNQKALLQAAKHAEPAAQVAALKRLSSEAKTSETRKMPRGYEQLREAWAKASDDARARFKAEVLVDVD